MGANFLWHVLAVAKLGYDSPYSSKYSHTVPSDALAILDGCSLALIENNEPGVLADYYSVLPAWLGLRTQDEFQDYFDLLYRSFLRGSFKSFESKYPTVDWSDELYGSILEGEIEPDSSVNSVVTALSEAFMSSYTKYEKEVWPEAEKEMDSRCEMLKSYFSKFDCLGKWHDKTGNETDITSIDVGLCYSNIGGDTCVIINYDKYLVYYDRPYDRTCQYLSHVIGAHTLRKLYDKLEQHHESEGDALKYAYDAVVMYHNRQVLDHDVLSYDLPYSDDGQLQAILDKAHTNDLPIERQILDAAEHIERNPL